MGTGRRYYEARSGDIHIEKCSYLKFPKKIPKKPHRFS